MLCQHSVFITETAPYGVCASEDENKVRAIVYKKKAACKNFKRKEDKKDGKNE